ncbi:MAG: sigma-70 family RNA polymerase sigma factor [Lentisphaerae bacterium]|jgi:RNA polymerase sigma factor (sigma-70 family)|nr:sigma-70 family RNA polymerase sigma factor [Lentisphaerota bacterium]MBT5610708.1 sigma-70 family RNA polymerase sigma factor [Lentisphaerota bacterium]MBT7054277.1 sigma-70 family RNA polymerase sigma factor [Lentisphaerota bacterium]MBT7844338.1 sigma-70 family RNA polymerase sigma factor [Lentisphaerota bacterium]
MTSTVTISDRDLVERARTGDQDAFRDLVVRYQRLVFSCALTVTRNSADAADVTQEAFIRFHRNAAQFDLNRPLKPYLVTIAMNCARNVLRKRSRTTAMELPSEPSLAHIPDTRPTPEREMARGERRGAIRSLINSLPQRLREVCSLFYLGERSCAEIAGILEMNESAVKVALHRARKKLVESGIREWRTV